MDKITIGIIGGTGVMGCLFEREFLAAGFNVLIAGRKTRLTYKELCKRSQVVILSTPVKSAVEIAKKIGHLLKEDQLFMDFCSLKEDVVASMLENSCAEVCGTHPMFGPFVDSLKNQNVVICPGRGKKWHKWAENFFKARGAVVTVMDPLQHDKNMAVVQGLTHFLTISLGKLIQKNNILPDDISSCSTPIFRLKLDLVGRLFAQDTHLYSTLISENRHTQKVVDEFLNVFCETKEKLFVNNEDKKIEFLEEIKKYYGDFCDTALKESNEILNKLYD